MTVLKGPLWPMCRQHTVGDENGRSGESAVEAREDARRNLSEKTRPAQVNDSARGSHKVKSSAGHRLWQLRPSGQFL